MSCVAAAICYYLFNHSKVDALSALPKDTTSEPADLFSTLSH